MLLQDEDEELLKNALVEADQKVLLLWNALTSLEHDRVWAEVFDPDIALPPHT